MIDRYREHPTMPPVCRYYDEGRCSIRGEKSGEVCELTKRNARTCTRQPIGLLRIKVGSTTYLKFIY